MREIFEKVRDAVILGADGKTPVEMQSGRVNVPGQGLADVQFAEHAGVVAGRILDASKSGIADFLGYVRQGNVFEIVALAPANSKEVVDVVCNETRAGERHVQLFATRLSLPGFNPAPVV